MRYVIKITTAGDVETVKLQGEKPTVEELTEIVGGDISAVQAKQGVLIVNHEAQNSNAHPLNGIATDMMHPKSFRFCICGDAVLVQEEGNHLIGFFLDRAERIIRGLKESVPA